MNGEWTARIIDDWQRLQRRLVLFRQGEDSREQVIGWDDFGMPIVEHVDHGSMLKQGFVLPDGAVESLTKELKPGPSEAEMARVVEALEVERGRVNAQLERVWDAPDAAHRVAQAPLDEEAHKLREEIAKLEAELQASARRQAELELALARENWRLQGAREDYWGIKTDPRGLRP